MSTKIYNAYKLDVANWNEALVWLQSHREQAVPLAQQTYLSLAAKKLTFSRDEHLNGLNKTPLTLNMLHDEAREERKQNKLGYRSPDYDYELIACLYPEGDSCYLRLLGENLDIHKHLLDDERLTDFHYQNSTDRPKELSEEEWEERDKIWARLMPSGEPTYNMFSYYIVSEYDTQTNLYRKNDLIELQPSKEDRARHIAKEVTIRKVLEERGFVDNEGMVKPSEIMNVIAEVNEMDLSDLISEYQQSLPDQYTLEEFK